MKTIAISGGFDPVHVGHLRMMKAASDFAEVIVILNSDDWLERKKGYVFMPFKERKEIIEGFYCVQEVVAVDDSDDTVCKAILRIKPDFFGNLLNGKKHIRTLKDEIGRFKILETCFI